VTALALAFASVSMALYAWSYVVYPPLIARLARRRAARGVAADPRPPGSVEVIVSAADEEDVIAARVADLLAQKDAPGLSISIGCDGCRDRTAERAREAAAGNPSVRIVEFRERRGKAAVVNDLVAASTAEILVFTDANTRFDPGAVAALAAAFADPGTAAVCGRLRIETGARGEKTPEAELWDRETRLKEAEGALGACVGANGAIYAARRRLVEPLPLDTTSMDDFLIPARAARGGQRVVFASEAVAREEAARDVLSEMRRRFRIGIGAGQVLRRERWLFAAWKHPTLTLAYASRKAARWLAPLAGLCAAAIAVFSPALFPAGAIVLGGAALAWALALSRPRLSGAAGRLYYFAVLNLALALGVAAGLVGYSRPVWARTARG
jgi:cellulose synthase/poly-beta-1,6-N-acetylglucosamine synthase-like glycosyltransferase